jgi:hypothetical protein
MPQSQLENFAETIPACHSILADSPSFAIVEIVEALSSFGRSSQE